MSGQTSSKIQKAICETESKNLEEEKSGWLEHHPQVIQEFFKWLADGGAKFSPVYLKQYNVNDRGVFASEDILKGKEFLYLPRWMLMTDRAAAESKIGKQLKESKFQPRSRHTLLACWLLTERADPKSKWKPYIDTLPKSFHNMPLFFNKEQLAKLKCTLALDRLQEQKRGLETEYGNLVKHLPWFKESKIFTYQNFVWARLIVLTRMFLVTIGSNQVDALVPFVDLMNHKEPRVTTWDFNNARNGFVAKSLCHIKSGTEIFDTYGLKCNSRYFVNYGFVPEGENPFNTAVLRISYNDDAQSSMVELLQQLYPDAFHVSWLCNDESVMQAFSFVRFLVAEREELEKALTEKDFGISHIPPLSYDVESRVLDRLAAEAQISLSRLPFSVSHDRALLLDYQNYPLRTNQRNIVLARLGEREVLVYYVELAKAVGPLWKRLAKEPDANLDVEFSSLNVYMWEYVDLIRRSLK